MNISYLIEVGIEISIPLLLIMFFSKRHIKKLKLQAENKIKEKKEKEQKSNLPAIIDTPTEDQKYQFSIGHFAKNSTNFQLTNSGVEKARWTINCILETTSNINLFEMDLDNDVFSDTFLLYLEDFLERGGKLNILLEKLFNEKTQSCLIKILEKYYLKSSDQVNVLIANKDVLEKNQTNHKNNYFMVGDERAYRFESKKKHVDHTAVINFKDIVTSKKLNKLFLDCSENSVNYFYLKLGVNYEKVEDVQLKLLLELSIQEEIYEKSAIIRDEINRRIK